VAIPAPWRSIKVKLPAIISALLFAAVAAGCWSAYTSLKAALFATTGDRIGLAAQRLATALDESALRLRRDGSRFANDSAVVKFLANPNEATRSAVRQLFDRQRTAASQIESTELLNRERAPLVVIGHVPTGQPALSGAVDDTVSHGSLLGPIVVVGQRAFIYLISPVLAANHDTVAFVAQFRRLSSGPAKALIEGLIGSDASLLFGNASGRLWTDLSQVASGPQNIGDGKAPVYYKDADGRAWLGVAVKLAHAPWLVWVQVPRNTVLAPARAFLFQVGALSLIIVAAGTLCGWWLSRHITIPLGEVTRAAQGLAAGEYALRVSRFGDDEMGRLAESFNSMAQQVQDTTSELELQAIDLESANEELRDSEERYRRLVELSPDGIIVHADGELLFANEAAATLLRADSPQQLLGRDVLDFVHPDGHEAVRERVTRNQEGDVTPLAERTLLRLDGTTVTVETVGIPFVYDGRRAAQTIIRDVSERKELEHQLAQSQKMEAVGRLAGGVAHDFNNLLTVISSYSVMALDALEPSSPLRGDVEEIRQAANRAAELTRQLLAFSRKQVLQPVPLQLNDVVAHIDKMLRRLIGEDVELVAACAADLEMVSADPGQIDQVIVNLAVNARDAMPNGGRLTIETGNVELSAEDVGRHFGVAPGRYVMLAVSDTGAGMSEAVLSRIFEPFFTTKEPGKGTGLGLSTVYGIVKQSGGDVSVYSEPGRGTSFKIYLPSIATTAGSSNQKLVEDVPAEGGSETVLVVEDDTAVRTVVVRGLRKAGYDVLEAVTEAEALALCGQPEPVIHLIISDLVMPGMGGRELARELQRLRPDVRVLFMSGYTEDAVMRHRFLEREAAFIGKPFTPERLADKVRELLDAA
jgi:PAS domain S-box-containing protein